MPSDDGGHLWAADHSQGLCRMDVVTQAPGLHAYNSAACDDGAVLGSGGQTAYDDSVVPGTTNQHYLYVAQNDHLSPGVIRFTFDPSADGGAGGLVDGSAVVMAPERRPGRRQGQRPGARTVQAGRSGHLQALAVRRWPAGRVHPPDQQPRGRPPGADRGRGRDDHRSARRHHRQGHQRLDRHDRRRPLPAREPGLHGRQGHQRLPDGRPGLPDHPAEHRAVRVHLRLRDRRRPGPAAPAQRRRPRLRGRSRRAPPTAPSTSTTWRPTPPGSTPPAARCRRPASAEATVYCTTTCTRPVDPANPPGGFGAFRFAQGLMVADDGCGLPDRGRLRRRPRRPRPRLGRAR